MEILIGVRSFAEAVLVPVLFGAPTGRRLILNGKSLVRGALLLLTGTALASCSNAPSTAPSSIGLLSINPTDATVFVGAPSGQTSGTVKRSSRLAKGSTVAASQDTNTVSCANMQFSAMAIYKDGNVADVSTQASWSSSNTNAASINATGQASGVALGVTYIQANVGKATSGPVPLFVDQLNSLAIGPAVTTVPVGSAATPSTLQLSATGSFTHEDGSTLTRDVTSLVAWSSTAQGIATVDPTGVVSAIAQGQTTIVANVCGISGSLPLTVGPPAAVALQVTPATPTVAVGMAVPFTALELYSDGTTHPLSNPQSLAWTSSSNSVSPVTGNGVAFGAGRGISTITATESGTEQLTGTATLTVLAAQTQFAYVANLQGSGNGGSISSYTMDLLPGSQLPVAAPLESTPATSPQQALLDRTGNYLYSIDSKSNIHVYQVTTLTTATSSMPAGTLTLLDNANPAYAPVVAGSGGSNVGTIDPSGQFLYVIDRTANSLYGFAIQLNPNAATPLGSLQPISGSPFTGSGFTFDQPSWVMTDQSGTYLYVINAGNNSISGFVIDNIFGTGALTPIPSSGTSAPTGKQPTYGTRDNAGHIFVVNSGDNSVSAYTIASGGGWGPVGTLPVPGATSLINAAVSPNGQFIYALDEGGTSGGQVFAYNLTTLTSGTIFGTQVAPPVPVGVGPTGIVIDPSGVVLAVDNSGSNSISLFSIATASDSTTPGMLVPANPASVSTDQDPHFVVFYNGLPATN